MDIAGVAAYSTIQPLYKAQSEVNISMLKKTMQMDAQAVSGVMDSLGGASAKAMELSVNPNVGSMFDART